MSDRSDAIDTHAYTFLLKLTDRTGGMESVAATFAHRGVSITATVGNDGSLDPAGCATVVITFTATPTRKEGLRNALRRLSRVVHLEEREGGKGVAEPVRTCALVRLTPEAPIPAFPAGAAGTVEVVIRDADGMVCSLLGPPAAVDTLIRTLHAEGCLTAVTYATIAL